MRLLIKFFLLGGGKYVKGPCVGARIDAINGVGGVGPEAVHFA